jgi:hypothetical protein
MSRTIMKLIVILGGTFLLAPLSQIRGQKPRASALSRSHLELMGFTLEKSTLADVDRKLGPSSPGSCSREADASKMICYVSDGADKTRVTFESGPSGGWSVLDGFKVVSGKVSPKCNLKCKITRALGSTAHTSGGLKLGLTKSELLSLLGKPTKINGSRYTFEWSSKRPMTRAEIAKFQGPADEAYWNVDDTIEVTLGESGVVEFEVHHTVFD